MKVAIGSDHAGFTLKEGVVRHLAERGVDYVDFGVFSSERSDFPDTGVLVAESVADGEYDLGILICYTGIGMSIVANKVPGIRAALCRDSECAVLSREHNDSNILVLGACATPIEEARGIVDTWLCTQFPGEERHARRIRKIAEIDEKYGRGGR